MNIAVIDIETGGFNKMKNGLCEIALVILDPNNKIIRTYSSLIKPYHRDKTTQEFPGQLVSYKYDSMKVNGITEDELASGQDILNVLYSVYEILNTYTVKTILGHNVVDFDLKWLTYLSNRFLPADKQITFDSAIDTLKLSRSTGRTNNSLEALTKEFKINSDQKHRALSDCFDTITVYKNLIK